MTFSLFCCLWVGDCIHLDAICFTQCLDLLSTAENNLKKTYNNNNCFTVETGELQKCKLLSDAYCSAAHSVTHHKKCSFPAIWCFVNVFIMLICAIVPETFDANFLQVFSQVCMSNLTAVTVSGLAGLVLDDHKTNTPPSKPTFFSQDNLPFPYDLSAPSC